jgi:hypothetical protein
MRIRKISLQKGPDNPGEMMVVAWANVANVKLPRMVASLSDTTGAHGVNHKMFNALQLNDENMQLQLRSTHGILASL